MLRICSLCVLVLGTLPAVAGSVAGVVRVVDGDTFDIGGQTVRLHGIDAPEADQMCGTAFAPMWPCGDWVRGEVRAMFGGQHAVCDVADTDRYGRPVARCEVNGRDAGEAIVAAGLAFAYRRYAMDYDLTEKAAAVAGRGLHGQGIQSPEAFRATARRARVAAADASAPDGCRIKGNLSADGKRIYHMPGQRWYDRTSINTESGERWFCSEADAQAAGWRRAR